MFRSISLTALFALLAINSTACCAYNIQAQMEDRTYVGIGDCQLGEALFKAADGKLRCQVFTPNLSFAECSAWTPPSHQNVINITANAATPLQGKKTADAIAVTPNGLNLATDGRVSLIRTAVGASANIPKTLAVGATVDNLDLVVEITVGFLALTPTQAKCLAQQVPAYVRKQTGAVSNEELVGFVSKGYLGFGNYFNLTGVKVLASDGAGVFTLKADNLSLSVNTRGTMELAYLDKLRALLSASTDTPVEAALSAVQIAMFQKGIESAVTTFISTSRFATED